MMYCKLDTAAAVDATKRSETSDNHKKDIQYKTMDHFEPWLVHRYLYLLLDLSSKKHKSKKNAPTIFQNTSV